MTIIEASFGEARSPGIFAADGRAPVFELKFHLDPATARDVERWAREHLLPDPHGAAGDVGASASGRRAPCPESGVPLLPEAYLLELKFLTRLPGLFRSLLTRLPLAPARGSKYRHCVDLCGLAASRLDNRSASP